MKMKLIELGMLPYDVLVCWGLPLSDLKRMVEKKYAVTIDDDSFDQSSTQQGKTFHLAGNQTVIWLKWPPQKAPWTIAHEAIHAMNMICDTAGIKTSLTNDEILCYGVQHIMETLIKTSQK